MTFWAIVKLQSLKAPSKKYKLPGETKKKKFANIEKRQRW